MINFLSSCTDPEQWSQENLKKRHEEAMAEQNAILDKIIAEDFSTWTDRELNIWLAGIREGQKYSL